MRPSANLSRAESVRRHAHAARFGCAGARRGVRRHAGETEIEDRREIQDLGRFSAARRLPDGVAFFGLLVFDPTRSGIFFRPVSRFHSSKV